MNPKNLLKYRKEFNRAVDLAIKECSRETGITDLNTVFEYLKKRSSRLFRKLVLILAYEQIRTIIQKRLKHCEVSVETANAEVLAAAMQPEFDFFDMEQFRGVPRRITYPGPDGHIEYVEYTRCTKEQREASIAHLESGIAADVARRVAEAAAHAWLEPLTLKFGDLPAGKLVSLWMTYQQREVNATS